MSVVEIPREIKVEDSEFDREAKLEGPTRQAGKHVYWLRSRIDKRNGLDRQTLLIGLNSDDPAPLKVSEVAMDNGTALAIGAAGVPVKNCPKTGPCIYLNVFAIDVSGNLLWSRMMDGFKVRLRGANIQPIIIEINKHAIELQVKATEEFKKKIGR